MENVISLLKKRGFIDQMTSEELVARAERPLSLYIGFDPTAPSLHLGNLVGILALAWFQREGHTPVVLLGGATGRIGDPSGKSQERPLLSEKELEGNLERLSSFFHTLFNRQKGAAPKIVNNQDWMQKFSFVDFLRDVGKMFRIGPMLAKESVRARMESEEGMSFTEFSYQVLQAYDFVHLSRELGVEMQMGGSDQWGNITAGIELNRKYGGNSLYGATFPLLTRSDGKKFGKSEGGAIWLSKEYLSPYDFYQYLFRVPDADVIRLLKMLTFLDLDEIEDLERFMQSGSYAPNTAQKKLAEEVTRFVHGEEGLSSALVATERMAPGAETELNVERLHELAKELPPIDCTLENLLGKKYTEVAAHIGLCSSRSEALRLVQNGGAYLNNQRVSDPARLVAQEDLIEGKYLLFGSGKKKKLLVKIRQR